MGLLIIISIGLILITSQFLKKQKTSEANTKNLVSNDNSKQNEVKPKDLDLIGKWYSSDWDKTLEISNLGNSYRFYMTAGTTDEEVKKEIERDDEIVFSSVNNENNLRYHIKPINDKTFIYRVATSNDDMGMTAPVEFRKMEDTKK